MADFIVIERVTRFVVRRDGSGSVTPGSSSSRELSEDEFDATDRLNLAFVRCGISSGPEAVRTGGSSSVRSDVRCVVHTPTPSPAPAPASSSSSVATRLHDPIESEALSAVAELPERRRAAIVESLTRWASSMVPAGQLHRSIDPEDVCEPELIRAVDQLDDLGVHDASRFVLAFGPARCVGLVEWALGRDDIRDPAAVIASKLDLRAVAPRPSRRVASARRAR